MKKLLIEKINQSNWWHVLPIVPNAYKERGKFLASTYLQAEFYGKPNVEPEKVNIQNPIFGFSEEEILAHLFGKEKAGRLLDFVLQGDDEQYKRRITLDKKMHDRAKKLGYDSIVLMTEQGKKSLQKKRKPNSIELNVIF